MARMLESDRGVQVWSPGFLEAYYDSDPAAAEAVEAELSLDTG